MNKMANSVALSVVEIFPGLAVNTLPDRLSGLISRSPIEYCSTSISSKYTPEMLQEQEVYQSGKELSVPDIVTDYCAWHINNGLTVSVSRKYLTDSCSAAIIARKEALGEALTDVNEIKSRVVLAKLRSGERIPLAIHIEADDEITTGAVEKSTMDRKALLNFLRQNANLDIDKLEPAEGRMHGRQGPVSFLMEYPNGIQIFDHRLLQSDILRTTNCGLNTWSCAWVNFPNVLKKIAQISERLNGDEVKVFVAKGLTRAERADSLVPLDRVSLDGQIIRSGMSPGAS